MQSEKRESVLNDFLHVPRAQEKKLIYIQANLTQSRHSIQYLGNVFEMRKLTSQDVVSKMLSLPSESHSLIASRMTRKKETHLYTSQRNFIHIFIQAS